MVSVSSNGIVMDLFIQSWPVLLSGASLVVGGSLWAGKIFFMLQGIEAKIDCMSQNIATHEHDPEGRVVIPAR
jgi:hypothetical protein